MEPYELLLTGVAISASWLFVSLMVGAAVEAKPPAAVAGGDPLSAMMAASKEGEGGGAGMVGMALSAVKVMFPSVAGYLTFIW